MMLPETITDADGNICYITAGAGYLEVGTFRFGLDQAGEFLRAAIAAYHQAFTQQADTP